MRMVPPPVDAARSPAVWSSQPSGMLVRNPEPANGVARGVGLARSDAAELGVTVGAGEPHAASSRVAMQPAPMSTRVQTDVKGTSPRIAERSRLGRYRCEDNPPH